MPSLNHTLERAITVADGGYLDAHTLSLLEQYAQSYMPRLQTYQHLRDHSEKLVIHTLRQMAQTYPELMRQQGKRCKYDLSEVLRYIALAILRDDEMFFTEDMLVWLDSILAAHRQSKHCLSAYQYLRAAISASLPEAQVSLTRPYLDRLIQAFQAHSA
jgi:hypothetical protein